MDDFNEKDWINDAKDWKVNLFGLSDINNDVPCLLRKLADALDELKPSLILDITFTTQSDGDDLRADMTVYYRGVDEE